MKKTLFILLFAGVALVLNAAPPVELITKTEVQISELHQINPYAIMHTAETEAVLLDNISIGETANLTEVPKAPEPKVHPYLAKSKFKPTELAELKNRMDAVEGLLQSKFLEIKVEQKAYLINDRLLEDKPQRFKYNYMLTLREYWLFMHEAENFNSLPAFRLLDQDTFEPFASWHPKLGFVFGEDCSLHPPYQQPLIS